MLRHEDHGADGIRIAKHFRTIGTQLIHYRTAGRGPKVVILHDSPRSSRLYLDLMERLGLHFEVYALDTPGYGGSSPLDIPDPCIEDFAAALGETLAALGLEGVPLYARHTSAKIALDYAVRAPQPPARLILDGLAIRTHAPDEAFIRSYMHHCPIDTTGSFLAFEWTRIRDMMRWFPWFAHQVQNRVTHDFPTLEWLADYTIDVLSAGPDYAGAYAAAMRYDPTDALCRVGAPTIVAARANDVLYDSLDLLPQARSASVTCERLPADETLWLRWLVQRLRDAAAEPMGVDPDPGRASHGPTYVDLSHGQMLVHRHGLASGRPLLLLSTPTTQEARAWADALAGRRRILLPELPGYGDSDPVTDPTLAAFSAALASMLDSLGVTQVDLLTSGLATPLGLAFAAQHPELVGKVIIDGMPDRERASAERLFPSFEIDLSGAHLHRIWHYLRDYQTHWPWYDGSADARRATEPLLDGMSLYRGLLGILKQPQNYGDAAAAGMNSQSLPEAPGQVLLFELPGDPAYGSTTHLHTALGHSLLVHRPAARADAATIAASFLEEGDSG